MGDILGRLNLPLKLEDIVDKPYSVFLIGEMGVGKSTFLELLDAYQTYLQKFGLNEKLFYIFEEDIPKDLWKKYIYCKDQEIPDKVIYDVQIYFARRKHNLIQKSDGINYNPGFYFVDRSLHEDRYVFAEGLKHLFPDDLFEDYVKEVDEYLRKSPVPDLCIRLEVETPEVSERRIQKRGWGEKLPLSRYHKMAEDYEKHIDPWITSLKVPIIRIRTDYLHFDFTDAAGQNYFLWSVLTGLHKEKNKIGEPFWKLSDNLLPQERLIKQ